MGRDTDEHCPSLLAVGTKEQQNETHEESGINERQCRDELQTQATVGALKWNPQPDQYCGEGELGRIVGTQQDFEKRHPAIGEQSASCDTHCPKTRARVRASFT